MPKFLNSPELWNICVQQTDTEEKFMHVMHCLIEDDNLKCKDILNIINILEKDLTTFHKKNVFMKVTECANQIISYMSLNEK
jgi:hypothetical protein